ncbi:MAG: hypothetical protein CMC68_01285 [Flavobacteriaceae bacterium]|nr:hypothetical protein [Flavobacteriaceae bacterium]
MFAILQKVWLKTKENAKINLAFSRLRDFEIWLPLCFYKPNTFVLGFILFMMLNFFEILKS